MKYLLFIQCRNTDVDRQSRQHDDDSEEDDDDDDDDDDDLDEDIFKKKGSKKKGQKSMWKPEEVDDLVDVIISKEYYKKNLIFTNTKNQKNGQIYANIAKELQERAAARGQSFLFVAKQLRTKFKNLISICKNAALTVKTGTGLKRFQDDKGYGNWFKDLFPVVRTRDACYHSVNLLQFWEYLKMAQWPDQACRIQYACLLGMRWREVNNKVGTVHSRYM